MESASEAVPAAASVLSRRTTGQDDLAMLKGKTKLKIIMSFPARLDRVHTYPAVIRISGLKETAGKSSHYRRCLLTDPMSVCVNHALGGNSW
jgi:hypothetical protein